MSNRARPRTRRGLLRLAGPRPTQLAVGLRGRRRTRVPSKPSVVSTIAVATAERCRRGRPSAGSGPPANWSPARPAARTLPPGSTRRSRTTSSPGGDVGGHLPGPAEAAWLRRAVAVRTSARRERAAAGRRRPGSGPGPGDTTRLRHVVVLERGGATAVAAEPPGRRCRPCASARCPSRSAPGLLSSDDDARPCPTRSASTSRDAHASGSRPPKACCVFPSPEKDLSRLPGFAALARRSGPRSEQRRRWRARLAVLRMDASVDVGAASRIEVRRRGSRASARGPAAQSPAGDPGQRLADDGRVGGGPHRRQAGLEEPAVAGRRQPRVEHGDDAAVGGGADQPAGALGEQQRGVGGGDLHEAVAAGLLDRALPRATSAGRRAAGTGSGR